MRTIPPPLFLPLVSALCVAHVTVSAELVWQTKDGYRVAPVAKITEAAPGFTELAPHSLGIDHKNLLAHSTSLTNQIYLNGSGVAVADVNNDDLQDLYFCGLESDNQLYLNQGNWKFTPAATGTAIACPGQASTGTAFADMDGDGDPDLLVNGIRSGTRLFLNDGTGQFTEATDAWGLRNRHGSSSMAIADVNGDGWLDLYVVNYRNETLRDEPDSPFDVRMKDGKYELVSYRGRPGTDPDLVGRFSFDRNAGVLENGEADQLFLNQSGRSFRAVAWEEGLFMNEDRSPANPPYDWGLSAMFRDLNGDQWPDLYVCNDFQSPDRIWINDGAGSFSPIWETAIQQTSLFSMGLDVADIDRDGHDDIFVVDMLSRDHLSRHTQVMDAMAFAQYQATNGSRQQTPRNTLLHNRGNGDYAELARLAGIEASHWSWCPAFIDVDLDGYEDLLITTGHGRDAQQVDISRKIDEEIQAKKLSPSQQLALRSRYPELRTENVAFRNQGNFRFVETGASWGFDSKRISHGMALADLDNDGDQDVVITCLNDQPIILRNNIDRPRLRVQLTSTTPNRSAIGAKITVHTPDLPDQTQELVSGGRYLSSDAPHRVFALATPTSMASVSIHWRDGTRSLIDNLKANQIIEISKEASPSAPITTPSAARTIDRPLFRDVSKQLSHQHQDQPFDDAAIQPALPRNLAESGPGVSWFDFNGDGWEDLFVGAGRGGKLGVFRNARNGTFVRQKAQAFSTPVQRDHGMILGWQRTPSDRVLLMAQTNYEDARPKASALRQFSVVNGQAREDFIQSDGSHTVLAQADVDGDHDLDLFVGGSHVFGKYPAASESVLLINENEQLTPRAAPSALPSDLGIVQSARFADVIGDHHPELLVAAKWKPLRILRRVEGAYVDWDPELTWNQDSPPAGEFKRLSDLTGLWNSIEAGDFDGDGDLDIVAGNAGWNQFRPTPANEARRLYAAPESSLGRGLFESYRDSKTSRWLPLTDWTIAQRSFPQLKDFVSTFTDYGLLSMDNLQSRGLPKLSISEARMMGSLVLINHGDRLEPRLLPLPVQFSPVFGIGVSDFDADGNLDLILSQNEFGIAGTAGRQDAGTVLLLLGTGNGRFQTLPSGESGLRAYGEGRGLALCDFNHDRRMDIVASQRNAPTKTFLNQSPKTGIRITLTGPRSNPHGIGAKVRLRYNDSTHGPFQDITAGSGFRAQHAPTLVMGSSISPKLVEVQWPDGNLTEHLISENETEVKISHP